jgi:hypothetical protein
MNIKLKLYTRYGKSPCCGAQWRVMKSRDGNYLTKNCDQCGKSRYLGLQELPALICVECGDDLIAFVGDDRNYWYGCPSCHREHLIAEVVPDWWREFPYDGLAVTSDFERRQLRELRND